MNLEKGKVTQYQHMQSSSLNCNLQNSGLFTYVKKCCGDLQFQSLPRQLLDILFAEVSGIANVKTLGIYLTLSSN